MRRRRHRPSDPLLGTFVLALAFALAFSIGACADAEPEIAERSDAPGTEAAPTGEDPAALPEPRPAAAGDRAEVVPVQLQEFTIDMPQRLPSGPLTFEIENEGGVVHGFEIEGQAVERATEKLQPGESAVMRVDLAPGTYTVYCPVSDHRGRGMQLEVVIGGGDG